MTSAARRVSSAANSEQAANATLSSVNAVFTLSLILTQASSPRQAVRLLTTAVPSIASCDKVLTWHPNRSGDYYERAPDGISNALATITVPARLEMDESSSWWAFPLAPALAQDPIFLVIAGTDPLSAQEKFLLSVLAQLCGTVIAKLELLAAERANIEQVASLNADLASTVSTLTKIMETHRQLNEIVANAGEAGIAKTLHQLTRFPVHIQDVTAIPVRPPVMCRAIDVPRNSPKSGKSSSASCRSPARRSTTAGPGWCWPTHGPASSASSRLSTPRARRTRPTWPRSNTPRPC